MLRDIATHFLSGESAKTPGNTLKKLFFTIKNPCINIGFNGWEIWVPPVQKIGT